MNREAGHPAGKPKWDDHKWPQIVQCQDGNWYGVRSGWAMRVSSEWKGDQINLLREDGQFLAYGDPSPDWRNSLESRPTFVGVQQ